MTELASARQHQENPADHHGARGRGCSFGHPRTRCRGFPHGETRLRGCALAAGWQLGETWREGDSKAPGSAAATQQLRLLCRKLDTEPLGSLGTLRVVGSVVVCVVVCIRVQHSQRRRHESCQNCGKNPTQEKRKKVIYVTLVSLPWGQVKYDRLRPRSLRPRPS